MPLQALGHVKAVGVVGLKCGNVERIFFSEADAGREQRAKHPDLAVGGLLPKCYGTGAGCFPWLKRISRLVREDSRTRTEWHRVYAWRNLSKFAKTLQKGQLITLEGTLRYREVEDEGTTFKHRIAEIHATSMKRLSKIEAADDPADGAGDE